MKRTSVRSSFAVLVLAVAGAVGWAAHSTTTGAANTAGTYTGIANRSQYGSVQVTIAVQKEQITAVNVKNVPSNPQAAASQERALAILKHETLKADSARIAFVPGATLTSASYVASLQQAINAARAAHALA